MPPSGVKGILQKSLMNFASIIDERDYLSYAAYHIAVAIIK